MNDELQSMWEDSVTTQFEILSMNLRGGIDENQEHLRTAGLKDQTHVSLHRTTASHHPTSFELYNPQQATGRR
jgi:hypothetical protein